MLPARSLGLLAIATALAAGVGCAKVHGRTVATTGVDTFRRAELTLNGADGETVPISMRLARTHDGRGRQLRLPAEVRRGEEEGRLPRDEPPGVPALPGAEEADS